MEHNPSLHDRAVTFASLLYKDKIRVSVHPSVDTFRHALSSPVASARIEVPTILRSGTPGSAKYLFCGTHRNGPKTASQLSGYYIEMYPKQVALIS